ncbi:MAG: Hsp20/alpha crystallin family protein [Candidatus Binatia bacterium]
MAQVRRDPQIIPVRMYQTDEHLMIAAPMPGLEPEDIAVSITAEWLFIRGMERGPGQHGRNLLLDEWTTGPYFRQLSLPYPVDGARTNATYGNGILVLVMPKRSSQEETIPAELQLDAITATRGEHVGHSGSALAPTNARPHPQEKKSR